MQLYGFPKKDDLEMFRLLLSVNGIGPKAALGILSGGTSDNLRFAVLSEDVKTISKLPGIGKKTAQKLILELKDKLKLEDAFELKMANVQEAAAGEALRDGMQEAVEALTALGYSSTDALRAVRAVKDVDPSDVEAILKAALRNL
jgi:Holliday junction DNA helicase RuvA